MFDILNNKLDWEVQPAKLYPDYKSTILRAPTKPMLVIKQTIAEQSGPVFGDFKLDEWDHDLTKNSIKNGEPIGERIVVHGKVINENGQPIPNTLIKRQLTPIF